MKSMLKAICVVALAGGLVLPLCADDGMQSDAQKDLKKIIETQGINYAETAQKGITLSGYVDTSYTQQFGGRGTGFGGNQATLHEFDVNNNNFNVNAVKIAIEKALPDQNDWAAGFRVDVIGGSDAEFLDDSAFSREANGTPISSGVGVAIEQALVKFRIPVGNGLDIYAGKFVTFLGYEVIESPANPNFSRGLLFTNLIPLTNTGVYADYKFNDTIETKLGIVDGWNNSVSPGSIGFGGATDFENDYPFGGKALTGQLTINAPGKNANITQSFIYSPSGEPSQGNTGFGGIDNGPIVVYDIWGNWTPTCVPNGALTFGMNVDFGYNGASGEPTFTNPPVGSGSPFTQPGPVTDSNTWWGGALYTQYRFNNVVSLALRGEYIHEDPAVEPKFGVPDISNDDISETVTLAFNIWENLLTRAEYRYDHVVTGIAGFGANGTPTGATYQDQNEVALEAVYSF